MVGQDRGSRRVPIQPLTFAEAGVDKKLSARAQKLAAVPEGLAIPYASRK